MEAFLNMVLSTYRESNPIGFIIFCSLRLSDKFRGVRRGNYFRKPFRYLENPCPHDRANLYPLTTAINPMGFQVVTERYGTFWYEIAFGKGREGSSWATTLTTLWHHYKPIGSGTLTTLWHHYKPIGSGTLTTLWPHQETRRVPDSVYSRRIEARKKQQVSLTNL